MKTALVTGFTGQDGTLLSEYLLSLDYRVIGLVRRISGERITRIEHPNLVIFDGDLTSVASLIDCVAKYPPDEVYNLAAQSHVATSFQQPDMTSMVDYLGLMNLVTALKTMRRLSKLYQASSSEMYGTGHDEPINEGTPFNPNSPYAIAKTAAHYYIRSLRSQGWFACAGILFNHESEIRGHDFVTQKIARAAARGERVKLGNLDAERDWGYARDYVKAMHLMMQQDKPDEYVIGTGETHSVRELVQQAYNCTAEMLDHVVDFDPNMVRPLDVSCLIADASKAKRVLSWEPTVTFKELVKLMVDHQKELHENNH